MGAVFLLRSKIMRDETDPALSQLRQLCQENQALFLSDRGFFRQALSAFLWAFEMRPLEDWARANRLEGYTLSMTVQEGARPEVGVMHLTFEPNRSVAFAIPRATCRHRSSDLTISRWASLLPLFRHYLSSSFYRAGKIALNCGDGAPVAGLAFCSNRASTYLIPDDQFFGSEAYLDTKTHFGQHPVPWAQRLPIAFWRGATTGRREGASWRTVPRVRLAEIAASPDAAGLIDAGISSISRLNEQEAAELRDAGLMRGYVPYTDFNKYRYNIDIDGNTNAWSGMFRKLCAGSAILKVRSAAGWRQWYYDRLQPWVHFVPVEADMSDLIEKVRWLRSHDDAAAEIGRQGRELALSMTLEAETERAAAVIAEGVRELSQTAIVTPR